MKRFALFCMLVMLVFGQVFTSKVSSNNRGVGPIADPQDEGTVDLKFEGLMAMCFGDTSKVSLGLLNAHQHTPKITITRIRGEQRTIVRVLEGNDLHGSLNIRVEGESHAPARRYYAEDMENDSNDFRWTVDMESDLFQRKLYVDESKLYGKIHINFGLFFSELLSEKAVKFVAADNSGKVLNFNRRIAAPTAKAKLNTGDTLVIQNKTINLRFVIESGIKYEVAINNLPKENMANMDHWLHYYDVIGPNVTPYTPMLARSAAYAPRPIECNVAIFSQSSLK